MAGTNVAGGNQVGPQCVGGGGCGCGQNPGGGPVPLFAAAASSSSPGHCGCQPPLPPPPPGTAPPAPPGPTAPYSQRVAVQWSSLLGPFLALLSVYCEESGVTLNAGDCPDVYMTFHHDDGNVKHYDFKGGKARVCASGGAVLSFQANSEHGSPPSDVSIIVNQ